jgi:hypothetical protein
MTGDLSVNTIKENKGDTKFTMRNTQEGRGQGQARGGAQQRQQHNSCRNCGINHGRRICPAFGTNAIALTSLTISKRCVEARTCL